MYRVLYLNHPVMWNFWRLLKLNKKMSPQHIFVVSKKNCRFRILSPPQVVFCTCLAVIDPETISSARNKRIMHGTCFNYKTD